MAGDFPSLSLETISHWPKSDINDPTRRAWYPPFSIVLASLSTIVLVARLSAQCRRPDVRFFLDDALASAAWVFSMAFTVLSVLGTSKYGFDRHIWDVNRKHYSHAALVQWLTEASFLLSTCLIKLSVLSFYRRLDPPCTKAVKRIIYGFMLFTFTSSLAFLLYQSALCRPLSIYWTFPDRTQPAQRSCGSQSLSLPLQGSFSSLSTLYSTIIPFLVLRNIPMVMTQRWGLRAIALSGLIVMAIGIIRTYFLARLVNSANGDATWNGFNVFITSQLECQLAVICVSAPFLQWYLLTEPHTPITAVYPSKQHNDSVITRVGSSVSGQIKRSLHIRRTTSPRQLSISVPQTAEIPEWEFETLHSAPPRVSNSPVDTNSYDLYLAGHFGPPPPPKDSREMFNQYRRERHGDIV